MSPELVYPEGVDFAVAAFREGGSWSVAALPPRMAASAEALIAALRQFPGEGGSFGFVGLGDECFVAVREAAGRTRGFISDAMAIETWPLAEEFAELLGIDEEDEDLEEYFAIGDLAIFEDFGIDADGVDLICEDEELYPDEQVRSIANRLGFGNELRSAMRTR